MVGLLPTHRQPSERGQPAAPRMDGCWGQHRSIGVSGVCSAFPGVRELLFLGMGIDLKTSEQLDIIAWQGHEYAVASAIAEHLKNAQDWDWLTLTQVPATSTVLPQFAQGMQEHRNQCCTTVCDRAPHIDTSVSWEQFKGTLGRSMRRNVEYYARRLFKKYDCEFSRVRSLSDLDLCLIPWCFSTKSVGYRRVNRVRLVRHASRYFFGARLNRASLRAE